MAKKESRFILGLDFGEGYVKAVLVEKKKNKFHLVNSAKVNRNSVLKDTDRTEKDFENLQTCLQMLKSKGQVKVFFTFSNPSMVLRYLTMPKMPPAELKNALEWKIKNSLPFDLSQAYSHFWTAGDAGGGQGQLVIFLALAKELIDEKVALLKRAGLEAAGFSTPPLALAAAYEELTLAQEAGVLLFDLGHFSSNMSVVLKGQTLFSRVVSTGCYHLEEALKTVFVSDRGAVKFTDKEVEELLYTEGVFENKPESKYKGITFFQIMALMRPVLERLEGEVARSMEYVKQVSTSVVIKKILLTGGGARIKNFSQYLSRVTGIEIIPQVPPVWLEIIPQPGAETEFSFPQFALSLGAARGAEKVALPISTQETARGGRPDNLIIKVAAGGIILVSLMMFIMLSFIGKSYLQKNEFYVRKLKELEWVKFYDQQKKAPEKPETYFEKLPFKIVNVSRFSWFLGNALPKEFVLENLNFDNLTGQIKMDGFCYRSQLSAEENLARIMAEIRNLKEFGNPRLIKCSVRDDLPEKPLYFDMEISRG